MSETVKLPPRPRRPKWSDAIDRDAPESVVVNAIRGAANRLPWCRLWVNREHHYRAPDGRHVYLPGLATGSADLIGIVTRAVWIDRPAMPAVSAAVGVFVAIECKSHRHRTNVSGDQREWGRNVLEMGGVWGHASTPVEGLGVLAVARGVHVGEVVRELEAIAGPLGWTR